MPKRITKNTKTDFIVNMSKSGFMMLTFIFLAIACVGTGLSLLPYYLKKGTDFVSGGLSEATSVAVRMSDAISMLETATIILMAVGFFGFLILLISGSKKYFKPKENIPMLLLVGYLLMCVISTFMAYDVNVAIFGSEGRYEGLVSLIAYTGFFAASSQLTDQKLKVKLVAVICVVAVLQAVVGILQSFEATFEILPTFFGEKYEVQGTMSEHYIANGFAGSPYALASLLTMATALCFVGFMYCKNKKGAVAFGIFGIVTATGCILTKNLGAIVGLLAVVLCLVILEIVRIKSGHGLFVKGFLNNPLGKLILGTLVAGAIFVILLATDNFTFEDSYIVLQDSFSRLFLSRPAFYTSGVKVYSHIWKDMFTQIKDNFVFGMGADCIGMKMYGIPKTLEIAGSADRAYNEYLNMAASTGVVSLVFYLGFVAGCLKRGVKGVSQFFNLKDNWTKTACFAGCVGYLACGVFSVSSVVSTPVFFTLLGLCFSKTEKD
ncbi:MAG: O-antigen ligase family protein [Oscillospiraceae bacterium]|nr:O-antigen ligase family protein [Oscillospiraceae bacterium]